MDEIADFFVVLQRVCDSETQDYLSLWISITHIIMVCCHILFEGRFLMLGCSFKLAGRRLLRGYDQCALSFLGVILRHQKN